MYNNYMDILDKIPFSPNQAIVFDIDDTLIDSTTHQLIPKVFELYQYCRNKGYNIYIITARPRVPYGVQLTLQQLHSLGIGGFKNISIGDKSWDIGRYGGYGIIVRKQN